MEKSLQEKVREQLQVINSRIQAIENQNKLLRQQLDTLKNPTIQNKLNNNFRNTAQSFTHKPTHTQPQIKKPAKQQVIIPTPKVPKKHEAQKKVNHEKEGEEIKKQQVQVDHKQIKKPPIRPITSKPNDKKVTEEPSKIHIEKKIQEKPKILPTPKPEKKQVKKQAKKEEIKSKPTVGAKAPIINGQKTNPTVNKGGIKKQQKKQEIEKISQVKIEQVQKKQVVQIVNNNEVNNVEVEKVENEGEIQKVTQARGQQKIQDIKGEGQQKGIQIQGQIQKHQEVRSTQNNAEKIGQNENQQQLI